MDKTGKYAIVVLHEIYGVNEFIKNVCRIFMSAGFDVICPNLIDKSPFPYEKSKEVYEYFVKYVGFDVYQKINEDVDQLKEEYEKVFIVGFSAGAAIAWRCCGNLSCDGIVACYGTRIRDYTNITPVCPTLLIFATEESFDVNTIVAQLQEKEHVEVLKLDVLHGFMDAFSKNFNKSASENTEKLIFDFLVQNCYSKG